MATTPHLGLTLLEQAQAQKELTVNTALYRIEALLNTAVLDKDLASPPVSPAEGDVYIVADSATDEWSGHDGEVAYFEQVWRFVAPNNGLMFWVADESKFYQFDGADWGEMSTSSSTLDALSNVTIASVADGEALVYDAVNSRWTNGAVASGGSSYTDEEAQDAVGTVLTDSATIDFTYNDAAPSITASVKDTSIGTAKLGGDITAAGKALLDDADAAAQRVTLGAASLAANTFSGAQSATGFLGTGTTGLNIFGVATSSGSDAGVGVLSSHDGVSNARGALILAYGSNASPAGRLQMHFATGESFLIYEGGSSRLSFSSSGMVIPLVYSLTTASSANVFVASSGLLQRSTSSIRFKKDVEDMEVARAYDIVLNTRPVWYRSTSGGDRAEWSWWGVIAEEVAEVDPRLVHWAHPQREVEKTVEGADGQPTVETSIEDDETQPLRPEGVMYERFVVPLIAVVQAQEVRIAALEEAVAALLNSHAMEG